MRWTGFFLSLSPYILLIFVFFVFFSKFAGGQSGRHRRSVASFCGKFVVVVVVVFWDWNIRLLLLVSVKWLSIIS